MQLTDSRARRWAAIAFVTCCVFTLLDVLVPIVARAAWGQGWTLSGGRWDWDFVLGALVFVFPLVGYLIARQQPRNAVAWILLAVGLIAFLPGGPYVEYGHTIRPGSLPGVTVVAAIGSGIWAPVIGLIGTFVILLFPDGHLPSPRWRWVARFSGFAIAWVYLLVTFAPGKLDGSGVGHIENPLGLSFLDPIVNELLASITLLPIAMILCAAGLVNRFRRSSGRERLQLKWLTTAGAVVAFLYAAAIVGSLVSNANWENDPGWLGVVQNLAVFSFVLIPISIGVAILKHGLYEIDVVINKTVVFGLLAAFITVVYVGIVVGVGHLAGRGDQPNIVLSIAATTFVAVAFQPVRERVERFANRLVYGRRATPYEVLSDFADRVGGVYDASALVPAMARTVAEGLDASRVEVWLATGAGLVRDTSWPETDEGDETGPVPTPSDIVADKVVEVRHSGDLLGALAVSKPQGDSFRPAEVKILDDVAAQAGLVLRNVRLVEELRGSRERLMSSQDDERRRLERRLHDGAQHRLVTVASKIGEARSLLGPDGGDTATALDQLAGQLHAANEELSELARGIHPAVLTDLGLAAAVRALADRAPVPVGVDVQLDRPLSRNVEATLYFVAAEALTNVAKYAHATSVVLTLSAENGSVDLEVADDGIGGVDETRGSGVRGLRDRVAAVDGTIEIHSPPGAGTRLRCLIPMSTTVSGRTDELALAGRNTS